MGDDEDDNEMMLVMIGLVMTAMAMGVIALTVMVAV